MFSLYFHSKDKVMTVRQSSVTELFQPGEEKALYRSHGLPVFKKRS